MIPFERSFDPATQIEIYGRRYDATVLVCGSQMGKTDALLDVIGQTMEQRPAPIMYVGPSKDFLQDEFEPRLDSMLNQVPTLAARRSYGKKSTKWRKRVAGVPVALAWAGSGTSIRAMPAKLVLADEIDAIKNLIGEGDPFTIAEGRGFSYPDRMRAGISTPTLGNVEVRRCPNSGLEFWVQMDSEDVVSPIWRHWQNGTMHHYTWQCPHCDEWFIPRMALLDGIEDVSAVEAKEKAFLCCPNNGCAIHEDDKEQMNSTGRYVAPGQTVDSDGNVTGDPPETTMLSFWVSGLCSNMVTFGERAASLVSARLSGEQSKIQAATNVGFGECYAPGGGDVPEWQEVQKLSQWAGYTSGQIPSGVRRLTLTVDVQKLRLIYVIRGWGYKATSWLIEAGEIAGPTTSQTVWDKLAELMTRPIGEMTISRAFIDSGYRPGKPYNLPVNRVYQFCRRFKNRAFATKGRATLDKPVVVSRQEIKASGRRKGEAQKYGLDLVLLDTDWTKSWVHERVRWPQEDPGAWHLPSDVSDDYCKQIVSEARVRKPNGSPEWVQRSRDNHFLDCEAMQAGLAHWMRYDLLTAPEEPDYPADEPETPPKRAAPRKSATSAVAALKQQQPKQPTKPARQRAAPHKPDQRTARRKRIAELTMKIYG